jgi:hypothetical protein
VNLDFAESNKKKVDGKDIQQGNRVTGEKGKNNALLRLAVTFTPLTSFLFPLFPTLFFLDFRRRSMPNSASIPSARAKASKFQLNLSSEATVLLKGIFRTKNLYGILSALGDEENAIL